MKNLNKYTKAELISKFQRLENNNSNQSFFSKIFNYILMFKGLILKITLITFIIKWIKKYSLIKKLWHIFSLIGTSLFGLSLIDIYSLDFISWIRDTSIYKWYYKLIETEIPNKVDNEFQFPKRITKETSENETST